MVLNCPHEWMADMKALILDGSSEDDRTSEAVHRSVVDELLGLKWEVQTLILREMKMPHAWAASAAGYRLQADV